MNSDIASKNIYILPFEGEPHIRPAPFHFEQAWQRNAVDFALDVGTPILAAGDGLVYKVVDGHGDGEFSKRFLDKCNLVILRHEHGEYTGYVHLKSGLLVRKGRRVNKGQLIGYSGLSGYVSYPHLHFQTMVRRGRCGFRFWTTVPTRFRVNRKVKVLVSPKE